MMNTETKIANKWNPNCGFVRNDEKQTERKDKLNRALVCLGKRCFIASDALRNGSEAEAGEKFEQYLESLNDYIQQVETAFEQQPFFDFGLIEPKQARFTSMKFRLRNFLGTRSETALRHPELFAKALDRIDQLIVDMHVREREEAGLQASTN